MSKQLPPTLACAVVASILVSACRGEPSRPGNSAPVARIQGVQGATEGTPVTFDASESADPDGDALSYAWDFGDGAEGTGASVEHSFPDQGSYTVTVRVSDGRGRSATAQTTVQVANAAPSVELGGVLTTAPNKTLGVLAVLRDPGVRDTTWSYLLDWGDGRVDNGEWGNEAPGIRAFRQFQTEGTYRTTITVADKDGAMAKDTVQITVRPLVAQDTVQIDIFPGTNENELSMSAPPTRAALAVLGDATFDVARVLPATALVGNDLVGYSSPLTGNQCDGACVTQRDVNGDGRLDLVLEFRGFDVARGFIVEPTYQSASFYVTLDDGRMVWARGGVKAVP